MIVAVLLVAHIAVLGYWLGSELVINHTFRYVSWSAGMPFAERDRLLSMVMDVDQHVRYALVLQAGLGTALAALDGFFPGGEALAWAAFGVAVIWLAFVEATHRARNRPYGPMLAAVDRATRAALVIFLIVYGVIGLTMDTSVPHWLALKLMAFAGVIACGLGIRVALIHYFRVWQVLGTEGSTDQNERALRRGYIIATGVLAGLWTFIAVIVVLSVWKPA